MLQTFEKMNHLKALLAAQPDLITHFQTTQNLVENLVDFAAQNAIELTPEELEAYLYGMHTDNQALDDSHLTQISGGATYRLDFTNRNAQDSNFYIFQKPPTRDLDSLTIAWLTKGY